MSGALQQESLTVCQTLDLLAQGRVAAAMDVLNQRLKLWDADVIGPCVDSTN